MPYYSECLLDHVRHPRNGGELEAPDAVGRASLGGRAPRVAIYLKIVEGVVAKAKFKTFGCGVSIACCSLLTELVAGRPLSECQSLTAPMLIDGLDGVPDEKQFCAQMAIDALRDAVRQLVDPAL